MADSRKLFQNGKIFETFVASVLRQMAAEMCVPIHFDAPLLEKYNNERGNIIYYDAIAPDGFGILNVPVVFEFKYVPPKESGSKEKTIFQSPVPYIVDASDEQLEKDIRNVYKRHSVTVKKDIQAAIVLITSRCYSQKSVQDIRYIDGTPIIVWDGHTVKQWCEEYPVNYSNAVGIDNVTQEHFSSDINESDFLDKSKSNIKILQSVVKDDPRFALVLGAGISVDPGAPLWDNLLSGMQADLTTRKVIDNSAQVCKKIGDSSLITAQLCRDLYKDERSFCWAIHEGLYKGRKHINPKYSIYEVAKLIDRCKAKRYFRVLTYNFDDYLEEYLDNQSIEYNSLFTDSSPMDERVSVYHVHGFLPQVNGKSHMQTRHMRSIFLTEENYNDLYNHPYSWQISSQLSFFRENVCLFVGCSLVDPNLRRLLEMTKSDNKTHFAIMQNNLSTIKDLTVTTTHFARLGVEVIWVDSYSNIGDVLRSLH